MNTISKVRSLTALSILATAFVAVAFVTPTVAEDASKTYVVGVEGMVCPSGCTSSVQEALETVDGVEKVDVNFKDKNATVAMEPGKTLTADSCEQAFGNSGYFVSSFDEAGAAKKSDKG